jgi:hypothetical protein
MKYPAEYIKCMSDQEGYIGPASPEAIAAWNAKSIKGTAVGSVNNEFTVSKAEQTWEYARFHQINHRGSPDPNCAICKLDIVVKQAKQAGPVCKCPHPTRGICGYPASQHIGATMECP